MNCPNTQEPLLPIVNRLLSFLPHKLQEEIRAPISEERLAKLPGYLGATLAMLADQVVPVGFKGRNYLQSLRVNLTRVALDCLY